MSPEAKHHHVEHQFRAALAAAGLPEPDSVEHWETQVAFFWDGPKVLVVVDLDSGGDLDAEELRDVGLDFARLH